MRIVFALLVVVPALLMLQAWMTSGHWGRDLVGSPAMAQAAPRVDHLHRYTRHPSHAAPEIVTLRIDGPFDADDRAKVVRAIEEWNRALNGYMRFDIATPGAWLPRAWDIRTEKGGSPQSPDPAGQALSFTQAGFAGIGGRLVVYIDRIGTRDLRGVVLHELGHVLGLGHDTAGILMSARYSPTTDQCIDKGTAQAIAALRKLPLDGLNWCEPDLPLSR